MVSHSQFTFSELTLQIVCPIFFWIFCFFLEINMRYQYRLYSSSYMRLRYRSTVPYPKPYHWLQETNGNVHLAGMVEIMESYNRLKIKYGKLDEDQGPRGSLVCCVNYGWGLLLISEILMFTVFSIYVYGKAIQKRNLDLFGCCLLIYKFN